MDDLVGDGKDTLEFLIGLAQGRFDFPIFEVMDIADRASATMVLVEHFSSQSTVFIESNLAILDEVREHNSK